MKSPILALLLTALMPILSTRAADPPVNVIVILADDLGYGDLGCYGQTRYQTPHLDRMAAEGARFTHFNTPAPFCAPTRAALLTGRYPFRCGMTQNPAPDGRDKATHLLHLPESEITLAQLFRQAGHATAAIGKWHLGHAKPEWLPTARGFDEYFGIPYSNDMRPVELLEGTRRAEYPVDQATLTKRYTERTLDFIERHRDRPFFLYLPHAMPHKPLAVSPDFDGKSGAGLYGDVIAELDWSVGQILDKLKTTGLDGRTLVIFTSDNGAWYGGSSGGLRGMKGSSYEGGYRVPGLVRWPGRIAPGQVVESIACTMDIFATSLDAAGISLPKDITIDGRSLLPILMGKATPEPRYLLGAQNQNLATIRDDRWKLHVIQPRDPFLQRTESGQPWVDPRAPDGTTILAPANQYQPQDYPGLRGGVAPAAMQLFDLKADPGEQRDVAAEHPEIVSKLKAAHDAMVP
ncbi:MAG: sulfatase [Verrucomicrobiales bacterium]|nr:sulfatase [Verrucomicrobiales bacterium]